MHGRQAAGRWTVMMALCWVALSWTVLSARQAFACSPSLSPPADEPTNVGFDTTPPVIFDVSAEILRPADPNPLDPCVGTLLLDVVAEDDQTPQQQLRYRVQNVSTAEPVFYYDEPVSYIIVAGDGKGIRLRIFALDEAGNQSAPFDFPRRDEQDSQGCNMAGGRGTLPSIWPFAALAWFLRRRRW